MKKEKIQSTKRISVRVPNDIYENVYTEAKKRNTTISMVINNRLQTKDFNGPEILDAVISIQNKLESISDLIDISKEVNDLWQLLK